ncbi:unnamed protein product [Lasius platythorax]|uniref:Uncharacterized protein n=1 Tax=Lasius platythorax TaxID=488582 RepID=A0AAV2NG58_9HYME
MMGKRRVGEQASSTMNRDGCRRRRVASTGVVCVRVPARRWKRNEYTMRCKLVRLGMPRRASQSPGRLPPVAGGGTARWYY